MSQAGSKNKVFKLAAHNAVPCWAARNKAPAWREGLLHGQYSTDPAPRKKKKISLQVLLILAG